MPKTYFDLDLADLRRADFLTSEEREKVAPAEVRLGRLVSRMKITTELSLAPLRQAE